ncbi:MAG: PilZ domain-containing protein [Burkholderiales bacterium]|nr:PilZ domain-containing protein [Burkholderiales bacterium]
MPEPASNEIARPSVIALTVRNKASLYAAYIPWLRYGGIFLPIEKSALLGEPVLLILTLMDDPAKVPVAGQVAWITPHHAHGNRPQGLGVQFADNQSMKVLKKRIEGILGAAMQSSKPTHTI